MSGVLVLTGSLVGGLLSAGCPGSNPPTAESSASSSPGATSAGNSSGTTAPAGSVRAALVTDIAGVDDKSFNAASWAGLQQAQTDLKLPADDVKFVEAHEVSDYKTDLASFASQKYNLVFAGAYSFADALKEVGPQFPDVKFAIIDGDAPPLPNCTSLQFKSYEATFLAGYLAASVSKTKTIGFVGGQEVPLIKMFESGYAAGAKTADPNAKVVVTYTGSWDDVSKGKSQASQQFASGADVIFHAAGKAGLGVIQAAKEKGGGFYAIGCDQDQDAIAPGPRTDQRRQARRCRRGRHGQAGRGRQVHTRQDRVRTQGRWRRPDSHEVHQAGRPRTRAGPSDAADEDDRGRYADPAQQPAGACWVPTAEAVVTRLLALLPPVLSVLAALLVGGLLIQATGTNALSALGLLLTGATGLRGSAGGGVDPMLGAQTLARVTPLLLIGLAVALALRAGLFNIGAQGQMTLGALTAALVGSRFALPATDPAAYTAPPAPGLIALLLLNRRADRRGLGRRSRRSARPARRPRGHHDDLFQLHRRQCRRLSGHLPFQRPIEHHGPDARDRAPGVAAAPGAG